MHARTSGGGAGGEQDDLDGWFGGEERHGRAALLPRAAADDGSRADASRLQHLAGAIHHLFIIFHATAVRHDTIW